VIGQSSIPVQLALFEFDAPVGQHARTPGAGGDAGIDVGDLFCAYYRCRANKRTTHNARVFEIDFETNLIELWHEINEGTYTPRRSVAFVVDRPVQREIFAADFRDRVVHHLVIGKLEALFEQVFIHDSYSCRKGKGTLFGVRRVDRFIRRCSQHYTQDAYVLKLDIAGFFMHINRAVVFERLQEFIHATYQGADKDALIDLCRIIVFNDPTKDCVIRGTRSDWVGLPKSKSLFGAPRGCGLPIGNLSSQVFANFYLNPFDHYVKHTLGVKFYGRYVDDMIFVHEDRAFLLATIDSVRGELWSNYGLQLHPGKIRLEHHSKGVSFLGAHIKPGRITAGSRVKGNFFDAITGHNALPAAAIVDRDIRAGVIASINSYLGLLVHYSTVRLRRSMLRRVAPQWWEYLRVEGNAHRVVERSKPRKHARDP
jgi:RNA-directed DNA polymerase